MAKKKRKHLIKLNNKIKSLFKNKPFDSAVLDFSDETLDGLMFILELNNELIDRDSIIKQIRRVWSEGDHPTRKTIVDFLYEQEQNIKIKKRSNIDLILSYLKEEDSTPQEEEAILVDFLDTKTTKITKDKILNRLAYIRMHKILDDFSSKLNVNFIGNDSLVFNQCYYLNYKKIRYTLTLEVESKIDYGLKKLLELDFAQAVVKLIDIKNNSVKDCENDLIIFQEEICKLEYMQEYLPEILNELSKQNGVINNLYKAPIRFEYVNKIIKTINSNFKLENRNKNIIVSKRHNYELFGEVLEYDISVEYEKSVLYNLIWTNKIGTIKTDIDELNSEMINEFNGCIELLKNEMIQNAQNIEYSQEDIEKFILRHIKAVVNSNKSLKLKQKISNRVIYYFNEEIKETKAKYKRQELLAKTIRDFKMLFPVARSLNREIIFNVGPTNSGKTYSAMQKLISADSGAYLAPLRLLALEGYENLKSNGVVVSLVTGEEEIIDEESTHISSTIEMLNSDIELDVCVIDEIQMIGDRDRGWAWANALIGAPAKKVIVTGSNDALEVVKEIAKYLNEPLTINEFERKNPLTTLKKPTAIESIEPNTAIVTFSRKDVLSLKSQLSDKYIVSVIYGNLSPEVRREEARRFREGESEVLIATDAIAMGLNLPIQTLLFARDNKFDGFQRRELTTSEILQISGRAGRYGIHESGYVGALDYPTLKTIKKKINGSLKPIELPIDVMASLEHVLLIGEILETNNLLNILEFFASNMEFEGPFEAANIDSMMELAKIVDEYNIDLITKYQFACAPVSLVSPYLEKVYRRYIKLIEEGEKVDFTPLGKLAKRAISYQALLNAEDKVKEVSLYLWLSFKFSDKFLDTNEAKRVRDKLNGYIENTLRESNFDKFCRICNAKLDLNYRFSICDKCHTKMKRRRRRR